MQTYYLSKYALSEGIVACDGEPIDTNTNTISLGGRYGYYRLGRDVHLTRDAAVQGAKAMQKKRIASLKKSLMKLEALEFGY